MSRKNALHYANLFGHFIKIALRNKLIISHSKRFKRKNGKFTENIPILDTGHHSVMFQICVIQYLDKHLAVNISTSKMYIKHPSKIILDYQWIV